MEVDDDFEKQCKRSSVVDEDDDESEEGEEGEEKKIWLKPADPCLLCGKSAVHYDVEGNVIKRETPSLLSSSSRLQWEESDYSAFFACIFKCFRVEGNRSRRRPKAKWKSEEGGPLPICESCEELVGLLLQMYDKVEELESKIRMIATQAEKTFEEGDLYKRGDDGYGDFYAEFRGSLNLVGKQVEPVPRMAAAASVRGNKRRTSGSSNALPGGTGTTPTTRASKRNSASSSPLIVSLLITPNKPPTPEISSESMYELEAQRDENAETDTRSQGETPNHQLSTGNTTTTTRRRSLRNSSRQATNKTSKKYVELPSGSSECDDDEDDDDGRGRSDDNDDPDFNSDMEDNDDDDDDPQKSSPTAVNRSGKGKRPRYRKGKQLKDYYDSGFRNCRVDRTTGNIYYSVLPNSREDTKTKSASALHLEFLKQSPTCYKCAQCSRPVEFPSDKPICRVSLIAHVRRFHPTGRSTTCPVCGMPLPSSTNSAYLDHRMSHLSEEEKAQAIANPVFMKKTADGRGRAPRPRFPPLPPTAKRRKLTPQVSLVREDVSQCPTCGKLVAGGTKGLRAHELTHRRVEEKKSFLCATCGASFTSKYYLELHTLGNHPGGGDGEDGGEEGKLFRCSQCGRQYKTEKSLAAHMEQAGEGHSRPKSSSAYGEGRWKVAACSTNKSSKDFPFQCPKCPWSFRSSSALLMHNIRSHRPVNNARAKRGGHGVDGVVTCRFSSCRVNFDTLADRLAHYIEAHPNTKEAAVARPADQSARCQYPGCNRGFPNEPTLQSHVVASHNHHHEDDSTSTSKVVECMCFLCGRVLVNYQALSKHHLIHSKEKRHRCPRCPSSSTAFRTKDLLNSHLARIHGEGPQSGHFRCEQPDCDGRREFKSRPGYRKHMRVVHKINLKRGKGGPKKKPVSKNERPPTTTEPSSPEAPQTPEPAVNYTDSPSNPPLPADAPPTPSQSSSCTVENVTPSPRRRSLRAAHQATKPKYNVQLSSESECDDDDGGGGGGGGGNSDSDFNPDMGEEDEVDNEKSSSPVASSSISEMYTKGDDDGVGEITSNKEVEVETTTTTNPASTTSPQIRRTSSGKGKRNRRGSRKGKKERRRRDRSDEDDRICRVDAETGNISYSIRSSSQGDTSTTTINLEFVKQSSDSDDTSSYKCAQCSRTVSFPSSDQISRVVLFRHARRFHPTGTPGLCLVCDMPLASLANAEYYEHRLSHLSEKEKAEALANPVYTHARRGRYPKPRFPPLPPSSRRKNITPEVASLRGDVNQCPTCGKYITRGIVALRRHEQTHLPPEERKSFLCATCGAGFTAKYSLDMHILASHPSGGGDNVDGEGKLFKCSVCPRRFKTEKSLGAHMAGGEHMKPQVARKPTTSSTGAAAEVVGGGGSGSGTGLPFQCPKCPSSFSTSRGLIMHNIHNHRGLQRARRTVGVYSCRLQYCHQRFASKEERQAHYSQAHPNTKEAIEARPADKAVTCNYPSCSQAFPDESHLEGHVSTEHAAAQRSSTGGSMCSLCGRVLVNDWSLSQHALTHAKEKKVACPRCPRTFITKPLLNSHLAAVHGEGPVSGHFRCEQPGCDKEYRSRYMYYQHSRQVHNLIVSAKGKQQQQRRRRK